MPKVFVVNFAGHDYSEAKRWGELIFVTTGYINQNSLDRLMFDITLGLKPSQSEDWLLPSGLLILNVIASAFWLRKHGELKFLVRDKRNRDYREMHISGSHLDFLISSTAIGAEGETKIRSNSSEGPGGPVQGV